MIGAGLEAELAPESLAYGRMRGLQSGKHVTQPIPHQNPRPAAGERRLRDTPPLRGLKSSADSVICRRVCLARDDCHGIHGRVEITSSFSRQVLDRMNGCDAGKRMPSWHRIPCRGELGRHQHGQHAARCGQLQPSLEERHRQIRLVPIAVGYPTPPAISATQPVPNRRRYLLRAEPGWVSYHHIEPALGEDISEVALIVEPGHLAISSEPLAGLPQRPSSAAKLVQPFSQLSVETPRLPEEIARSGRVNAFRRCRLVPRFGGPERLSQSGRLRPPEVPNQPAFLRASGGDQLPTDG